MFGSVLTRANQGVGKRRVLVEKQVVEGKGRFSCQGAIVSETVLQFPPHRGGVKLDFKLSSWLNAILCLLGNLPASELLLPTFWNSLSILSS